MATLCTRWLVLAAAGLLALGVGVDVAAEVIAPYQVIEVSPGFEAGEGKAPAMPKGMAVIPNADLKSVSGPITVREAEPNGAPGTATPLGGSSAVVFGNIYPNNDLDYFSFTGAAGDRVYAATQTSFSASASVDSVLVLYGTDGTTVIEQDLDDGSFGSTSSSIAGATLPADGTYYLLVKHNSTTSQLRPYNLYFRLRSGAPTAETEPNDAGQALPAGGWVSGDTSATTDVDLFTFDLNAGDTVFLSLDLDPERDATEWNGTMGLGPFNGFVLVVNDAGAATPDSEAFFMTVKAAGTHYAYLAVPTGGTTFGTYHLSVSVFPASNNGLTCTTYTATDTPVTIPDGPGLVTSTITIPGTPRIADLDVAIDLTHLNMPDLDVNLVSPAGNDNGLFNDIGSNTQTPMNLVIDDEGAIPVGVFTVVSGMVYQPELAYRLSWFDGENAGGTWTLTLRDDLAANGATLNGWSVTVCEPAPLPQCPAVLDPVTVYSSDFELDEGGFTHSGTADEWERGLPSFIPITTCNSGSNCWKTDLDNTYNASSIQDLLSPVIDLTGLSGPVLVSWAQRYHIESASFDHAYVDFRWADDSNPTRLFEWLGASMNATVGNPSTTINESAGWALFTAEMSAYAGQQTELLFHLDSDSSVQYTGFAVDDVTVTACEVAAVPSISLAKTVGTTPGVCATTSTVSVLAGTTVYYCYEVTNTGDVTLNLHDLSDDVLGTIFTGLAYALAPGASVNTVAAGLSIPYVINNTTTNTGTWTAYNAGPIDVATATASATVTVAAPPDIDVAPTSLAATQDPNTTSTQQLTISNLGGLDLAWQLFEEPAEGPKTAVAAYEPASEVVDPEAALAAELSGLEEAAPKVSSPRDPAAAARAQRKLLTQGLLLIPDSTNDRVMAFDPVTGDLVDADFIPADPTNLSTPKSAILSAGGDSILVADQVDDVVQEYDLDGNYLGVFAPAGGANPAILDNILGIDLRPNDNLLVPVDSGANQDSVAQFDTGGAYLGNFIAIGAGGLDGGFDVWPLGTDWLVTSINSDNVLRYDSSGAPLGVFAPAVAFGEQINGAGNGNVLVANFSTPNTGVMEFTPAGALVGVYSVVTGNRGVYELPNGNILTTNGSGVFEIDRANNLVSTKFSGSGAQYIELAEPPSANCTNLLDVPWLSSSPITGTIPPAGNQLVDVTFDSTGLAAGTYNANLCALSNDPDEPVVQVPVALTVNEPQVASISLAKTVGTTAGVCATTSTITVAAGTTVYYCYEVTNTGNVTLNLHDLIDDQLGTIFTGLNYTLAPGASVNTVQAGLSISAVISTTTINNAAWVAYVAGGPSAQATASATVNVATGNPAIELTKTVGTVAGVCAVTDTITVATGTEVYYCYQVENTGDVTFNFHDLVDDQLGTLLNDLPYALAPGAFSPQVIVPETITAPVVNTGTWTAMTDIGGYTVEPTTFSFVDISASGTALNLTDDSEANITIPFGFTFYGVTSSNLRVGNNGGILFNATTGDVGITNATLPNATIGLAMLPFWDDMDSDTGNVYWEVQGAAPNRTLIVEWYNRPHYSNVGAATFEVILYEGTNAIVFQYLDTDFGNSSYNAGVSATVGINKDGSVALQYSYNQAVITDGLALRFDVVTPQMAVDDDTATVNLSDPDINVTPASMVSSLLIGTTQTQVLSIGNTGAANLDWTLNEAQPNEAVYPPMASPAGPGDVTVAAELHGEVPVDKTPDWIAPPVAWEGPELVLYDNGPLVTHPGGGAGGADASALQTALGMTTYGFGAQLTAGNRVADDFTITQGNWTIETISFFTYQTGSSTTSTITGVNLQIWDGPPNAGGTVVWGNTTTNVMTSTTWSNIYRVLDTTMLDSTRPIMAVVAGVNTTLPAGTYWLDWQFDGTLSSGPWQPPITILGQTTTGNALQYTTTGWAAISDGGTLTPQGLPFIVEGTSSNCYMPEDIPWLSASPTAGTTAPGGTTPVDVTFDATATPIGTYEALLCVFSNDPDEPLVEVPVTMEVVIPVELMGISIE